MHFIAEESEEEDEDLSEGEGPGASGAAPPSFAPPKPAMLTPHQIVIMQPTPEVESKDFPGKQEGDDPQEGKKAGPPPVPPPPPPREEPAEVNGEVEEDDEQKMELTITDAEGETTDFALDKPNPKGLSGMLKLLVRILT